MSVTYSTIKALSQPDEMAAFLAARVIGPVLPAVEVAKVRTKEGRRFEAPRILWNVYEAQLELPGGVKIQPLFWTKAYFNDADCQKYASRIGSLLNESNSNPLDPTGYARFFPELNLFLFFFPTDPVFRALPIVHDVGSMRPILEPLFKKHDSNGSVDRLSVTRVKYLPEISCLTRYDADVEDAQPLSIYGKVQHSRRGQLTYDVMRALWELPARVTGDLVVSEPLAYFPQYDLLLQSAVPGEEIPNDRHSDVFMQQCESAGRTIGYIHSSGITVGEPHTVDVEMNRLVNRLEEFKMSSPKAYLSLRDLLEQIRARTGRVRPEPRVPSHGDYKYNQFLYDGRNFGLIDVEYFVQAEPSFDLGKYCGHLAPSVPRHWSDTAQANEARRIFLKAYCAVRPDFRGTRFPIYEALSFATRALVVTWAQSRNWENTAETLISLAYERLKTPWGE